MGGRLEFEFRTPSPDGTARTRRQDGDPFRILVLGDFSGGGDRAAESGLENRNIWAVDVDNFEHVLEQLAPRVALATEQGAGEEEIDFACLDDFHPDALFKRLDMFADLRRLRARLLDAKSFAEAAAALAGDSVDTVAEAAGDALGESGEQTGTMFERLLGGRIAMADGAGPASRGAEYATQLIEQLIEPHIERGVDADQQRLLVATVDDAIANLMRSILHDLPFQDLEAAWRGLWWLVSTLESGAELQIHLVDASRQELNADLLRDDNAIGATALYRRLVDREADTVDGAGWSLLVGNYRFGPSNPDLRLLAALGAVASRAGGPFVAEADSALLGTYCLADQPDPADWTQLDIESEQRWQALRRSPVAPWLGLALPRVLLRLPYDSRSDPVEHFAFNEMASNADHNSFLWGSPAIACALLMGRAFSEDGWDMELGSNLNLEDLPAFTYVEDGGARLKPCAEVLLSHRTADSILARGIMPVLSHRDRNAARFARIQSVADPPTALAGPWR